MINNVLHAIILWFDGDVIQFFDLRLGVNKKSAALLDQI